MKPKGAGGLAAPFPPPPPPPLLLLLLLLLHLRGEGGLHLPPEGRERRAHRGRHRRHRFPVETLVLRRTGELFVVGTRGVVGRDALLVVVVVGGPAPRARAPVGLRAGGLLRLERLERRVRQGLRHVRRVAVNFFGVDRPVVGAVELVLLVTVRGDLGLPVARC